MDTATKILSLAKSPLPQWPGSLAQRSNRNLTVNKWFIYIVRYQLLWPDDAAQALHFDGQLSSAITARKMARQLNKAS